MPLVGSPFSRFRRTATWTRVAIALRTNSPIFVDSAVIEKAKSVDLSKEAGDQERLRKWLENLDPDELGKYEM